MFPDTYETNIYVRNEDGSVKKQTYIKKSGNYIKVNNLRSDQEAEKELYGKLMLGFEDILGISPKEKDKKKEKSDKEKIAELVTELEKVKKENQELKDKVESYDRKMKKLGTKRVVMKIEE